MLNLTIKQFSQLFVTVTTCGAQNIDMINLLFLFLPLFFDSVLCVPPVHQELPRFVNSETARSKFLGSDEKLSQFFRNSNNL